MALKDDPWLVQLQRKTTQKALNQWSKKLNELRRSDDGSTPWNVNPRSRERINRSDGAKGRQRTRIHGARHALCLGWPFRRSARHRCGLGRRRHNRVAVGWLNRHETHQCHKDFPETAALTSMHRQNRRSKEAKASRIGNNDARWLDRFLARVPGLLTQPLHHPIELTTGLAPTGGRSLKQSSNSPADT